MIIENTIFQHTTILLTSRLGETKEILAYDANITENFNNKVKQASITGEFLTDEEVEKFSVGSTVSILTARKDKPKEEIFYGYISQVPRALDGRIKKFQYQAICPFSKTENVLLNESYQDELIEDIFKDMIKRAPFLKIGTIQSTNYVLSITFKDVHLYDAIERLCKILDFTVTLDRDVISFHQRDLLRSNIPIEKNMFQAGSASFNLDTSRLVNSISAYGSKAGLSVDVEDKFIANGIFGSFILRYKPVAATSGNVEVYLNDVLQKAGVQGLNEDDGTYQVWIDFNEKVVQFNVLPVKDAVIRVVYRYQYPVITKVRDLNSIDKHGLYEDTVSFPDVNDRQLLKSRAREHLMRYGNPILIGSLSPFENRWRIGELVQIVISDIGVEAELQVTEKTIHLSPNSMEIDLQFEQNVNLSEVVKDILLRLKELEQQNAEEIAETVEEILESITIKDRFSFQEHDLSLAFILEESHIGDLL